MKQLRLQHRLRREEGLSLAEFALILPVFLTILLGMVDLGKGFNTYLGMLNAAREGSLWVARYPDDIAGMNARMTLELARVDLTLADMEEPIATPDQTSYETDDIVTVRLRYSYQLMFGAITGLPTLTLDASNTAKVQPQPNVVP